MEQTQLSTLKKRFKSVLMHSIIKITDQHLFLPWMLPHAPKNDNQPLMSSLTLLIGISLDAIKTICLRTLRDEADRAAAFINHETDGDVSSSAAGRGGKIN